MEGKKREKSITESRLMLFSKSAALKAFLINFPALLPGLPSGLPFYGSKDAQICSAG
jgi:hypothetical protein